MLAILLVYTDIF